MTYNTLYNDSKNRLANVSEGQSNEKLICALIVLTIMLFTPSIIGQNLAIAHGIVAIIMLLFFILIEKANVNISSYAITIVPFTYLLITSTIIDSKSLQTNSYVYMYEILGLLLVVLAVKKFTKENLINAYVSLHLVVALSLCISIVIFQIVQMRSVLILSFPVKYYEGIFEMYFPFTVFAPDYNVILGFEMPRFCGIYREPGLMQGFFATAWLFMLNDRSGQFKRKDLYSLIFAIGIVSCVSTNGIFSLLYCLVFMATQKIKNKNIIFKFFGISAIAFMILVLPFAIEFDRIGLSAKINSNSGLDRVKSIDVAVRTIESFDMFGCGRNTFLELTKVDSITGNIFCATAVYGIIGILIYFTCLIYWLRKLTFSELATLVPIIITMMVSQPLSDTIPFWFAIIILSGSRESSAEKLNA